MNLYEKAVKARDRYLAGQYQPGQGWFTLRFYHRGETYLVLEFGAWEVYRQTGEGLGKYCLTL